MQPSPFLLFERLLTIPHSFPDGVGDVLLSPPKEVAKVRAGLRATALYVVEDALVPESVDGEDLQRRFASGELRFAPKHKRFWVEIGTSRVLVRDDVATRTHIRVGVFYEMWTPSDMFAVEAASRPKHAKRALEAVRARTSKDVIAHVERRRALGASLAEILTNTNDKESWQYAASIEEVENLANPDFLDRKYAEWDAAGVSTVIRSMTYSGLEDKCGGPFGLEAWPVTKDGVVVGTPTLLVTESGAIKAGVPSIARAIVGLSQFCHQAWAEFSGGRASAKWAKKKVLGLPYRVLSKKDTVTP